MTPLDLEGLTWSGTERMRWPQVAPMLWDMDPAPTATQTYSWFGLLGWITRRGYATITAIDTEGLEFTLSENHPKFELPDDSLFQFSLTQNRPHFILPEDD